jgi:A/G-specific adenine glycosylase
VTAPFHERLLDWYDIHGRKDLPWQHDISPYHVWLSEIMLQQTQVSTVIPYYLRFITQYGDITSLASAKLDDILALWAGLGYYARARNLHKAANILVRQHKAEMPFSIDELIALPGIGRSTAGAIMALAHQQKHPILDGNVKRVLARYTAISGWPGKKPVEQKLWKIAESLLPEKRITHYTQAQMDLGATICKRNKPLCLQCPLHEDCKAFQLGTPELFPTSKPKKEIPTRQSHWLIAQSNNGKILLEQRPNNGIWGGLWSFPEFDCPINLVSFSQEKLKVNPEEIQHQTSISHVFTHFKLDITPYLVHSSDNYQKIDNNKIFGWYTIRDALQLGIPAPVKAFLTLLE